MKKDDKYKTRLAIIACACREAAANQSLLPHGEAMGLAGLDCRREEHRLIYHEILRELTADDLFRRKPPITAVLCSAAEWYEGFLQPGRPFLQQLVEGSEWNGDRSRELIAVIRGQLYRDHAVRPEGARGPPPYWRPEPIRHTTWTAPKR